VEKLAGCPTCQRSGRLKGCEDMIQGLWFTGTAVFMVIKLIVEVGKTLAGKSPPRSHYPLDVLEICAYALAPGATATYSRWVRV